jgi:ACS family tartrate transporter-like MFS transporter
VVAFVDRINLGFAALTMNQELAISSQQFGLAAGIFFWGYFLFEIPSNLMLHKVGARRWLSRILVTWGAVAVLTGFVHTSQQLYIARFALGLAEAGFFPGVVLYLGYWFPLRERARALATILIGIPLASILGAPASGAILAHVHGFALSSWRWLLILEGLPALVLGVLAYRLLPNRPAEVSFLTTDEKKWLASELARDEEKIACGHFSAADALRSARVWHLALIGFGHGFATYSFSFWLPQMVKLALSTYSTTAIGWLISVPSLLGLIAMVAISVHSDRTMERRKHLSASVALAGIAMLPLGMTHSAPVTVLLLTCVTVGAYGFLPLFFSVPGEFLSGYSAAAGIALITSVANLGGFVGPYTVGAIRERTGSLGLGMICGGCFFLLSAALALALPDRSREMASTAR